MGREDGLIADWMEAADDLWAGWLGDAQAYCTEGDAAIGGDAGIGALAPSVRPPRAAGSGEQGRAFLAQGELPGALRGGSDLTLFFLCAAMHTRRVMIAARRTRPPGALRLPGASAQEIRMEDAWERLRLG